MDSERGYTAATMAIWLNDGRPEWGRHQKWTPASLSYQARSSWSIQEHTTFIYGFNFKDYTWQPHLPAGSCSPQHHLQRAPVLEFHVDRRIMYNMQQVSPLEWLKHLTTYTWIVGDAWEMRIMDLVLQGYLHLLGSLSWIINSRCKKFLLTCIKVKRGSCGTLIRRNGFSLKRILLILGVELKWRQDPQMLHNQGLLQCFGTLGWSRACMVQCSDNWGSKEDLDEKGFKDGIQIAFESWCLKTAIIWDTLDDGLSRSDSIGPILLRGKGQLEIHSAFPFE